MPIDAALLERIKINDPTLKTLDLTNKALNDNDIQQLVNAIATNATLTTLRVEGNGIGNEGAIALAANATLTTLNVRNNRIDNEGAIALAANATLTTLNVRNNRIGDEGAIALAANATLTTLDVGYNRIGDKEQEQLQQAIARNNQQMVRRRDQFIQALIVLASDQVKRESQSLWSQLPKELMLHIISLIDVRPPGSIGKSTQQTKACVGFIFNNISQMKASLAESLKTKQDFKIVEKIAQGKSHFQFFPPKPQIKSLAKLSEPEESMEKPSKIQRTV